MNDAPERGAAVPPLEPNTVVNGRFRILEVLSEKAEGRVYLAVEEEGEQARVVLKEFPAPADLPDLDKRGDLLYDALEFLETRSHSNLAHIRAFFSEADRAFVAFDFIGGSTLLEWCAQERVRLTETQIYDWTLQIVDAMTCLHEGPRPFTFPTLDASHIVVGPGGQLKIIGFGLRRAFEVSERGGMPYLFSSHRDDVRADIRAVGRVIVALMSRIEEPTQEAWAFPSPSRMGLHRIISRCMSHEPDFAYTQMREILEDVCSIDRTSGLPIPAGRRPARETQRWWEPDRRTAILPRTAATTGRLHFASAQRPPRRQGVLTVLGFLAAAIALAVLAWSALRTSPAAARTDPVLAAFPSGDSGAIALLSADRARALFRETLPGRVVRAAGGADVALVGLERQVLWFDTSRDTELWRFDLDEPLQDVAVTADGAQGFVLTSGGIFHIDRSTGAMRPFHDTAPSDGGTLAISPDGSLLVVTHPASRSLDAYDVDSASAVGNLTLEDKPGAAAFSPDGSALWVALPLQGRVMRLEPTLARVVGDLTVGAAVNAMAVTPDSSGLILGLKKEQVAVLVAVGDGKELARVPLPGVPGSIATNGADQVWVACWKSNMVPVLTLPGLVRVRSLKMPFPPSRVVYAP